MCGIARNHAEANTLTRLEEDLWATQGRSLLLAMRPKLCLEVAYSAFRFAAETADRAERLHSAAWDVFGRAVVVALSFPGPKSAERPDAGDGHALDPFGSDAGAPQGGSALADCVVGSDLEPHAKRIADKLDLLADAGRAGGNLSAATVSMLATSLSGEFRDLLKTVERMLPLGAVARPRFEP